MKGKPVAHDSNTCNWDKTKIRHFITCKTCRTQSLVWHTCNIVGGQDRYALYESVVGTKVIADTMKPHVCRDRFAVNNLPAPGAAATPAPAASANIGGESLSAEQIKEIFDEVVARSGAVTSEDVMRQIDETIGRLAIPIRPIRIELRAGGEVRSIEGAHRQVPELLYWANAKDLQGHRFPVMLYGKPGVSKSYSAHQVANLMGLSFGLISLNPQTPESRLFGFIDASGRYHRTMFREAFENGGLYLIDEIDNASDALLTSLNSCLANGHGAFPDGLVNRHPDFVCVATANTPGRGGDANHSGRRQLDAATINRFAVVDWQNDDELEMRLARATNPKCGEVWLNWIRRVREYCGKHHPKVIVSPRSTMMGAKAILDSQFTLEQIADMTLFKGLDKDTKAKIIAACPMPVVVRVKEHLAECEEPGITCECPEVINA